MKPKVTLSLPVHGRPIRTKMMIGALLAQTEQNWEAFVIGDACPVFEQNAHLLKDPRITSFNRTENGGFWGYAITNYSIEHATGEYFMWLANDDLISYDHIKNYLSAIEGTNLDFVWFPNALQSGKKIRFKLKHNCIGHAGLIVRTEFLKRMPPHRGEYHHDFQLLYAMLHTPGVKYRKARRPATYHIDPLGWRYIKWD